MKKVFMIMIAAVLLLSLAGVVSADEINNISVKNNVTTTVKLDLDNEYTVTIPAEISLSDNDRSGLYRGYALITASITLLEAGSNLTVNVTNTDGANIDSPYNWTLHNNTNTLVYHMKVADGDDDGDHISTTDADIAARTPEIGEMDDSRKYMVYENEEIIRLNKGSQTVYLHMRVYDKPDNTGQYTDTLKFIVDIK